MTPVRSATELVVLASRSLSVIVKLNHIILLQYFIVLHTRVTLRVTEGPLRRKIEQTRCGIMLPEATVRLQVILILILIVKYEKNQAK